MIDPSPSNQHTGVIASCSGTVAINRCLYIFLDEGGNLDFSTKGSKHFTLSAITQQRPFLMDAPLLNLKFDLIEFGLDLQRFHASEDRQAVRDRFFQIIASSLGSIRIDSIIVDKRKTGPGLRPVERFYPRMLGYVLRYIFSGLTLENIDEVIVITDTLPVTAKRKAIEKGIKVVLAEMLPKGTKYRVLHHSSFSCVGLQVADYCNWAIFRKWESGDHRSYELIQPALKSEFDIFHGGTRWYY
jgi:hypothetical protein